MTDQELNEAVARKLGWQEGEGFDRVKSWERVTESGNCLARLPFPPAYSTSIEAAWEIVNAGHVDVVGKHQNGKWSAGKNNQAIAQFIEAETAPRAICLAFLKIN